jgi:hypothetical protein
MTPQGYYNIERMLESVISKADKWLAELVQASDIKDYID